MLLRISLITTAIVLFSASVFSQNVGINTSQPDAALDVYGEIALKSAFLPLADGITYDLDVNTNKFSNYKLSGPTSNFIIAGISPGVDGVIITLYNRSGFNFELYHEDANAAAEARINTSTNNAIEIYNDGNVTLQYDGPIQRWQVLFTHNGSLDQLGNSAGNWAVAGDHIYNTNLENIGIGNNNPVRAKLEVNGVAGNGYTSGIFGGEGSGLSFQRNWPTIGFNQYRDSPNGFGKAISGGYGAHMFSNPILGGWALVVHDSVSVDQEFNENKYALLVSKNGNLGVKTTSDDATLSIAGSDNFPSHFNYGSSGHTYIRGGSREHRNVGQFLQFRPSKVYINDISGYNSLSGQSHPGGDVIIATGGGNVGIGTENTAGYKLAVNGFIRAKELRINTGWADYVFEKDYPLMSLEDIERFIQTNKHLPNIPPAAELIENGVDVSKIQEKMMAKIEELTLHLIEANKQIKKLHARVDELERR